MTRAVLVERYWTREDRNRAVGLSYPNGCNLGSAATAVYTLYAAWQQKPVGTALGMALTVGLKRWWLRCWSLRPANGLRDACSMDERWEFDTPDGQTGDYPARAISRYSMMMTPAMRPSVATRS